VSADLPLDWPATEQDLFGDFDCLAYGRPTVPAAFAAPEGGGREPRSPLATVEEALADFAAGAFVLVVDDEDRENEGDLCVAAEAVTAAQVAFMARHAGGLICSAMTGARLDELELGPVAARNTSPHGTAFTVSVDARDGTTTGISAHERALTIRALVDPTLGASDFVRPGHVFPLRAAAGGIQERQGHTEAAVHLAGLAGLRPAGVICEIMNRDGTMARGADLAAFARRHGIRMVSVEQLATSGGSADALVSARALRELVINDRPWRAHVYEDLGTGDAHLALVHGECAMSPVLVRPHSCCLTGDVFGSDRCDCGAQLQAAMRRIEAEGSGVVLYFGSHEGRGIGLVDKLRAYALQERGLDTVEANAALQQPVDDRDYTVGAAILDDLALREVRLLTNNPEKLRGFASHGIRVVERVALRIPPNAHNAAYLQTKREKMGHWL
jgi:3,4-dihydroxy 2-butanone 4-phosphate synthase/GTP cyclohydrolase II